MEPLEESWPMSQGVFLPAGICGGLNTGGPEVSAKTNGGQVSEIRKESEGEMR